MLISDSFGHFLQKYENFKLWLTLISIEVLPIFLCIVYFFNKTILLSVRIIKLRIKMGNVSKGQQPDHRKDNRKDHGKDNSIPVSDLFSSSCSAVCSGVTVVMSFILCFIVLVVSELVVSFVTSLRNKIKWYS